MHQTHFDFQNIVQILSKIINFFHFKLIFAIIMAFISSTFKGNFDILISLYVLVLVDTVTGVYIAIKAKEVSSRGFYRVAVKCLVYFAMLLVARLVDKHSPVSFSSAIMDSFLVITEAISILENLGKLGFPVPTTLLKTLKITKDKK